MFNCLGGNAGTGTTGGTGASLLFNSATIIPGGPPSGYANYYFSSVTGAGGGGINIGFNGGSVWSFTGGIGSVTTGGGGGASFLANGGNGATASTPAQPGVYGSGGGGGVTGNPTGARGGDGYFQIDYFTS
jgi:hypothetical protein